MAGQYDYAPYISEELAPAYKIDGMYCLDIDFRHNQAVSLNDVQMKVKFMDMNNNKIKEFIIEIPQGDTIELRMSESFGLTIGTFYKVQVQYYKLNSDDKNYFDENWSNASYFKYVGKIELYYSDQSFNLLEVVPFTFQCEDLAEKVYKYKFFLGDNSEKVPWKYHIQGQESDQYQILLDYTHTINYQIVTTNNLVITWKNKAIYVTAPQFKMSFTCQYNDDKDGVNLQTIIQKLENKKIYRRHSPLDPWEEIGLFTKKQNVIEFIDYNFIYGKEFQYISNITGSNFALGEIKIDKYLTNSYLSDADRTLCLKFNPEVSFKDTVAETKIETIGGRYPLFFKNGNLDYREFSISTLLSYQSDENELFMTKQELGLTDPSVTRDETISAYDSASLNVPTTSLTDYNINAERKFKMEVIKWLKNGKPKLLRTPTEGNYIVKVMDVSASPENTLGRMLHTVSFTAVECAECTQENYNKLILGMEE